MITTANLRETIKILGFIEQSADTYQKSFGDLLGCSITVDFKAETIIYPSDLRVNEKETCNFSDNENFVVLECITRLLDKGYRAEHIEIEKRWTLGHDVKGGRADICVYDESGKEMLLIVECKKSDEYYRYKKILEADGGQLFSYWQQEGHTKWLALYTSDLKDGKVVYENNIINCSDDSNLILLAEKDDTIKLYKNAGTVEEKFEVWSETYGKDYCQDIIFGADTVAYQIGVKPLRKKDLRDFTPDDKIVNRFEEILRHNNVSDKENAFNRLVALFICKLVDEIGKDDDAELEFQYKKGIDTYETLQDRLQKLHQKGMQDFMREEIFYVPNDYVENAFMQCTGQQRKALISEFQKTIRKLKFYTNNDFSFKDVHNEELFYQNGKVVVEVVQLFEKYRIVYKSKHQFLGTLFELLLNKGFKQNEGQFFTPMPITRFIWDSLPLDKVISNAGKYTLPKIIDYSCGAGHFLTEAVEAVNAALIRHNQTDLAKDNGWVEKNIYGIEKDYRLARVSKISLFMNGAGYGNIIFGDGLDNYPEKQIEAGTFDILVANPPYSVKAFKAHFKPKNNALELLGNITNDGSEIEVLFVERIAQLLKPKGIAAVILPSSILDNSGNSYISARENLLENFSIHAIAQFENKTFGETGTNTIVLFLEKYSEPPKRKELVADSVNAIQSGKDLTDWEDKEILQQFLAQIEVSEEDYRLLLSKQKLPDYWKDHAYFGQFVKEFMNSSEVKNKQTKQSFKKLSHEKQNEWLQEQFYNFVFEREQDKLKYFALVYKQKTLVVTAPTSNDEQKEFLGYEWKKGELRQLSGGKLYNDTDRTAASTVAATVRESFEEKHTNIPDLEKYLAWYRLQDMIDFSRVVFNKEIKTAVAIKQVVISKYFPVKLGSIAKIEKGQTITQSEATPGKIKVIAGGLNYAYMHNQANRDADIITVSASGANAGFVNFWDEPIFASDCTTLLGKTKDETLFIYNYLKSIQDYIFSLAHGSAQPHVYGSDLENIQVPLPPIDIQQQIVAECKKVDTKCEKANNIIEKTQQEIASTIISLTGNRTTLKDIAEFKNGLNYDRNSQGEIVKIVGVKDFENKFSPDWKQTESIQIEGALKPDYLLIEGDILIVRSNGSRNLVGRCIYIDETLPSTSFSGFTIRVRLKNSVILPKLLCYYLRTDFVRSKMFDGSKGSNIKSINQDILANIPVMIPDQTTQTATIRQIQRLEQQIEAAQKILDSAFARKQAILDKYLQ